MKGTRIGRGSRIGLAVVLGVGLAAAAGGVLHVQAVHNLDFCLQGDVRTTPVVSTVACGRTGQVDWTNFFGTSGNKLGLPAATTPVGTFTDSVFTSDFALPDPTTYATGSKDTLPISGNGSSNWQCAASKNLGAKVDLANTYAAVERLTSNNHTILDYGSEIQSANGDHNQGIWLLQDKNVACSSATGTTNFSGSHVNGDLLFAVELTGGGSKPFSAGVVAFEWQCTTASPAICSAASPGSLVALNGGASIGSVCNSGGVDTACAISNETWNVVTPWPPHNTLGTALGPQQFFEGGIDVTAIEALFGGTSECFSRFLTDTRSSQSPTATLFDYTQGSLSTCATPTLATALKNADGSTVSGSLTVGSQVYDTATLTGAIGTAGGTVTYNLYPSCANGVGSGDFTTFPATSPANYTTANGGAAFTANPVSTVTLTGGAIPNSDTLTFTQPGTFYFTASYSGDGINQPTSSPCEPITIIPKVTTLATTASTQATIVVGTTVTISDSATITGAFGTPGGTMTFTLNGPATFTSCGPLITTISGVSVSSVTTSSGSFTFQPTSVGTYYWSATWTGDGNNLGSSHAGCSVVNNATVVDSLEAVVVVKATPKLITVPFLGDVGTISGGFSPAGNVTFYLYANTGGTCTSGLVYTSPPISVGSAGLTASTYADLANAASLAAASLSDGLIYNWQVVYTDTSGLNNNVTVGCGSSTGASGSTSTESTGTTIVH
jgi:hypothetical protein